MNFLEQKTIQPEVNANFNAIFGLAKPTFYRSNDNFTEESEEVLRTRLRYTAFRRCLGFVRFHHYDQLSYKPDTGAAVWTPIAYSREITNKWVFKQRNPQNLSANIKVKIRKSTFWAPGTIVSLLSTLQLVTTLL